MDNKEQLFKLLKEYSNKNKRREEAFEEIDEYLTRYNYYFKWSEDQKFFKEHIIKKSEYIILSQDIVEVDNKAIISISYYYTHLHSFETYTICLYSVPSKFKFENDDY